MGDAAIVAQAEGVATATTTVEVPSEDAVTAKVDLKFAHKTLQDYEVLSVIGNGCFGTCYKVRDKASGELYVWKGVDYDDELDGAAKEALTREIDVLRQLQHPNIVQYYHHLINAEAKSIFIVMECCEGGDLAQLIARARVQRSRFEERYVWRVLLQLSKALQLCHTRLREGTLLHRDIKPANIFLDAHGNAKLGDFGLARMLRGSEEHFARTIVGTPYYMSPELMRGAQYDRTSDVWALGCLVYELCSLRPPFRGRDCAQLSLNIASGKFSRIPVTYSADLQAIIHSMLAVEHEQRPGIEVITRHPLVARNVSDVGSGEFPQLLPIVDGDFSMAEGIDGTEARCKLQYSPMQRDSGSTCSLADVTAVGECGKSRRLSVSGVFTPDLRNELFYSARRRVYSGTLQRSDPELYESIRQDELTHNYHHHHHRHNNNNSNDTKHDLSVRTRAVNPVQLTHSIFDAALQTRLHAIRAQESLLQQRELNLNARERQLVEWEKRLQEKEHELLEHTKAALKQQQQQHSQAAAVAMAALSCPRPVEPPPPIPPRKPSRLHDDTYCSIEPNDSLLQPPTVAKMDLSTLPLPKAFPIPAVRKVVTFQSPKKFISYDIENLPPPTTATAAKAKSVLSQSSSSSGFTSASVQQMQLQASTSSKSSNESNSSGITQQQHQHRRKSLLSTIFGLHRSKDSLPTVATTTSKKSTEVNVPMLGAPVAVAKAQVPARGPESTQILAKCQTTELSSMWTKEHKRAAFDLLAAMNAAERNGGVPNPARHKLRQSVRERNMQRSRLRRSMVAMPTMQPTATARAASNGHRGEGIAATGGAMPYSSREHIVV